MHHLPLSALELRN